MSRWILLRGLAREARHWGDFPAQLAAGIAGAEIHAVDLPGNGRHFQRISPTSVEAMVDHIRAELRARGIQPPWHLLALSLGGMVAAAWERRHPQEIAALVLINTSLRPLNPWWRRLRPGSWGRLLRIALAGRDAALRERLILELTSNRATEHATVLAQWRAWRNECPGSLANNLRQLLAAARFRVAAAPAVPTLILASAGDRLVDPACSRQLAARWGSAIALHPGAGHDLPLDDGGWIVAEVRGWLAAGLA
jgi:pimeloyl-ACP methyl ester carboxylesterase